MVISESATSTVSGATIASLGEDVFTIKNVEVAKTKMATVASERFWLVV
jgi:hypothetical protein